MEGTLKQNPVDLRRICITDYALFMAVPEEDGSNVVHKWVENFLVAADVCLMSSCLFKRVVMKQRDGLLVLNEVTCSDERPCGRDFIVRFINECLGTDLEVALFLNYDKAFPLLKHHEIEGWDNSTFYKL